MFVKSLPKRKVSLPVGITLPECSFLTLENLYHSPGEASAIRFFDPQSKRDLEVMRRILTAKPVKKWMDDVDYLSRVEYEEWAGTKSKSSLLFAVLDARSTDIKQINRVRGFVYLYSEREEKFRVKRMAKAGLFTPKTGETFYLEASFALLPQKGKGHTGSGLMSSALRQCCLQAHLLLNSPKKPDIQVFAFVDPENLPAKRTLEASGFVLKGHLNYDRDSEKPSALYVLNWRLLHKKVRKKLLSLQNAAFNSGV
jgi:hypothetical protein